MQLKSLPKYNHVVIDSNAFVLFILGTVNQRYIGNHKRLSIYNMDDFKTLCRFLNHSKSILTCPNIWTEVDNLCNTLRRGDKYKYINLIRRVLSNTTNKETYIASCELAEKNEFIRIGLTDTAIIKIAKDCDLLITADSNLSDIAKSKGINVFDLKEFASNNLLR